jgi:hypothetical protein
MKATGKLLPPVRNILPVSLVYSVCLFKPDKPNKPNEPDRPG